jgi:hypothetical protein
MMFTKPLTNKRIQTTFCCLICYNPWMSFNKWLPDNSYFCAAV